MSILLSEHNKNQTAASFSATSKPITMEIVSVVPCTDKCLNSDEATLELRFRNRSSNFFSLPCYAIAGKGAHHDNLRSFQNLTNVNVPGAVDFGSCYALIEYNWNGDQLMGFYETTSAISIPPGEAISAPNQNSFKYRATRFRSCF
jgi:hypothetical protein